MQGSYLGLFDLDGVLAQPVVLDDGACTPSDPGGTSTFRIYDAGNLITSGVLTQIDTGTVSGATNAAPIVITTPTPHKLQTGLKLTLTGVGGTSNANTSTTVTVVDPTNFSLDGTTGNGAYTSGGQWHVTGLYLLSLTLLGTLGFTAGKSYTATITWGTRSRSYSFTVT